MEFPDVSHYQAGLKLNGALACVAKATQGTSYVDPTYSGFRKQSAALGIPFSGYHWIDTTDPASQARWYHDNAAGAPCMWDAEAPGATVPRILAATAVLKALGGRAWGAYLPHWWWQGHIGSPDLRPLQAAGLALVSSDYRIVPPGAGWVPYGGVAPTVWQFTDKKPFGGQLCDFNRFNGTPAQLAALFAGTTPSPQPPQPPKPPEGKMIIFCIDTAGGLWRCDGTVCVPVPDAQITDQTYVYAGLGAWGPVGASANAVGPAHLPAVPVRSGDKRMTHLTVYDMGAFGAPAAAGGGGGLTPEQIAQIAAAVNDDVSVRMKSS